MVGQEQFLEKYYQGTHKKNKLSLIGTERNDVTLFAKLYISYKNRVEHLDEFFHHDKSGMSSRLIKMHPCNKSDLLSCLEVLAEAHSDAPSVTSMTIDGAVIVQML